MFYFTGRSSWDVMVILYIRAGSSRTEAIDRGKYINPVIRKVTDAPNVGPRARVPESGGPCTAVGWMIYGFEIYKVSINTYELGSAYDHRIARKERAVRPGLRHTVCRALYPFCAHGIYFSIIGSRGLQTFLY